MADPSNMSCVLRVKTQSPDWHTSLTEVLRGVKGISYTIDAQQGVAHVSGKIEPQKILRRLEKVGKHIRLCQVNTGTHVNDLDLISINNPNNINQYGRIEIDPPCYGRRSNVCYHPCDSPYCGRLSVDHGCGSSGGSYFQGVMDEYNHSPMQLCHPHAHQWSSPVCVVNEPAVCYRSSVPQIISPVPSPMIMPDFESDSSFDKFKNGCCSIM